MRAALAFLLACAPVAARAQGPIPLEGFARDESPAPAAGKGGPRLVVAILYDQYRGDLLDRYRPVFGKDGFARLIGGGARFTDCTIPYSITYTGPGHATWLSGAPPSVHGIVGNGWYDQAEGRQVLCVQDSAYASVGSAGKGGGEVASPRRMRAQTVADALRGQTLGAGRVVAISDKARGAVLPAGRRPNGVYWMDPTTGLYQTSTYYASALPAWVANANALRAKRLEAARGTAWVPRASLPAGRFANTTAIPGDGFPHPLLLPDGSSEAKPVAPQVAITQHPLALEGAFDFAEAAIDGERLGDDDTPDRLVLSVSVTDRVGHLFGPDSPEALDLSSRADSVLGAFLAALDRKVGRGRWTVVVTADHGVTSNDEDARRFEAAPFDTVGNVTASAIRGWIDRVLGADTRGIRRVAKSVYDGNVTFDRAKLDSLGVAPAAAARIVADSAFACPYFSAGYTADELRTAGAGDPNRVRCALGWFPGRSGDVVLSPANAVVYEDSKRAHAGHGGPQRGQRLVPFVLYGSGVRAGTFREPVSTFDIAPTVARILGVEPPDQCEGRARDEALAESRRP